VQQPANAAAGDAAAKGAAAPASDAAATRPATTAGSQQPAPDAAPTASAPAGDAIGQQPGSPPTTAAPQPPSLDASLVAPAAPSGKAGDVLAPVQPAVAQGAEATPQPGISAAPAPPTAPSPANPHAAATPAPRLPVHPDQARALLHMANHRGQAQARLTLHPAELGGVEIRLRVTTHGLLASITADRPESAQVLQQAGADLKRALEAQGVEVAGLDIGVAGDEAHQRAQQRDPDPAGGRGPRSADADHDLPPIDPDNPTTTAPTIALGALVDVLA
jgi:flagellar hook-length control protein FliK